MEKRVIQVTETEMYDVWGALRPYGVCAALKNGAEDRRRR